MRLLLAGTVYGIIVYQTFGWANAHFGWPAGTVVLLLALLLAGLLWKRTMGGMLDGLAKRREAEEARKDGNLEQAEQLLLAGVEQTRRSTNKASRGILHWDLVELYTELGRFDDAIEQLKAALDVTTGDQSHYGIQIQGCGPSRLLQLYRDCERWDDYEAYATMLISKAEPESAAALRLDLAMVLLDQGKTQKALEHAQAAEQTVAELPDAGAETRLGTLLQWNAIAWQARDTVQSLAASQQLLAASQSLPDGHEQRSYWLTLALTANAQAFLLNDDVRAALARAGEAIPIARASGDEELHAHSLYVLGRVLQTAGDPAPARKAAQQALQIWEGSEHAQNAGRARQLLAELETQDQGISSGVDHA